MQLLEEKPDATDADLHELLYPTSCVRGVIPARQVYKDKDQIIAKKCVDGAGAAVCVAPALS